MATLVLSSIGTALGGPVGGAIGALLGQAVDQQVLGSGRRDGPRLSDLAVQSSTYGTPIPRIYGTMRVAGSVIWATDLKESSDPQGGGKGQPGGTAYSYSVSFAVALSSRAGSRIGRIWADGKLLRGAGGDFKVRTGFRFHRGTEDQPLDPLISSIEGIASTPAYRGLSLAVFEDLELAEFGNRIPFLTFELVADGTAPTIGQLLTDASGAVIDGDSAKTVRGYAAYGTNVRNAIEPIVRHFGVALFDDGTALRCSSDEQAIVVDARELGCAAGPAGVASNQHSQVPARNLPSTLSMTYYDPARDYQLGRARSSAGAHGGRDEDLELPAVMESSEAKALVESSLARSWAQRETVTLRLPPTHLTVKPASRIQFGSGSSEWLVESVSLDSMVTVLEARRVWESFGALPADPGRGASDVDVPPAATRLTLLDLPDLGDSDRGRPMVYLAASSGNGWWRRVPIDVTTAAGITRGWTANSEALCGTVLTRLDAGQADIFDLTNSLEVELAHNGQWLESRTDEALINGSNLAAVGDELIQFGSATPLGAKRFRLSRLLRGRRGTEWAMRTHQTGEPFVLLSRNSLLPLTLPEGGTGTRVQVRALGLGDDDSSVVSTISSGENLRPPSPVHVQAQRTSAGELQVSWVRRSRFGWNWSDALESPLGESRELYRVQLLGTSGSVEVESATASAEFTAAQVASVGAGPASLSIAQVGDFAVSYPATMSLTLA